MQHTNENGTDGLYTPMLKPIILSIAMITVMSGAAVSPALGVIAAAFPGDSITLVKLVSTLPQLFIIPFSFLSVWLCRRFSKRTVLITGLIGYILGGACGGLAWSLNSLLFFRGVLGMGVGLIMPISTALVADFYPVRQQAGVMGQVTACNALGGIIAVILSGWLATVSWRCAFCIYLLGLAVFFLVAVFMPEPHRSERHQQKTGRLPLDVFFFSGGLMFVMAAFYTVPTNMALFIHAGGIGGSSLAGFTMGLLNAVAFMAGIIVAQTRRLLESSLVPVLLVLMGLGYLVITRSTSPAMLMLGVALVGVAFGTFMPLLFLGVSRGVPQDQRVMAMAVASSMLYLGQFISPVVFDGISSLLGRTDHGCPYLILAYSCGILAVVWPIAGWLIDRNTQRTSVGSPLRYESGEREMAGINTAGRKNNPTGHAGYQARSNNEEDRI